ncbi:MAG: hypothetical protein ACI8QT_001456, partial [Halioglobus sp.]
MPTHLDALRDSKYCPLWHDQDCRPQPLPALVGNTTCELL